MKENSKGNYKFKIAAILFFLVIVALYLLIYVAPKFSDAFVETYTAELGTLDVDYKIDYLCVRNERIHTADNTGSITKRVKAGSLLRNNSRVLNVGGLEYHSQIRGVVSYYYDGLESKLTPEKLEKLKKSSLHPKEDAEYELKKCDSKNAEQGDVIFKIVDNSEWYLVTWLKRDAAMEIVQGKNVTIELDDADKTQLKFKVKYNASDGVEKKKSNKNKKYKIIFSCDRYYSKFSRLRYGKARVITSQKTGIILETDSITKEDGQKGVYVKNKYGDYVFTPISIIAEVGDKTVVESRTYYDAKKEQMISTVKNYDSVKKGVDSKDVDQN
ncbi:MAG: HlyD family efflux transporter periplasmic adaptor subunit [Firmicutes bacterium]|nr:HlyD family efflux transporter periplasmic adaptor subunit [Bacillota bacterium]